MAREEHEMTAYSKRALVLSGGGAKGVFEAGVLKACHHAGLRFDVITGSSIGAINAVLFAEYLRRRQHNLDDAVRFMGYVLSIWEHLDAANLVDFDLLEPIVKDLAKVEIGLDDLLHMWWGLTGETLWDKIGGGWRAFWAFTELDDVLDLSLRDIRELYDAWRDEERRDEVQVQLRDAARKFLLKHKAEKGMFDAATLRHAMVAPYDESGVPPLAPDQGLSSFYKAGVDVRLTRTNVRSGRLEISTYRSLPEVLTRIEANPDSAGGAIVGDPNAILAALASAAFPVAFVPRTLREIYPPGSYENGALYAILDGPDKAAAYGLGARQHSLLKNVYPRADDVYIDGATLDNHPLSPAISAIKDRAYRAPSASQTRQILRASHDIFIIFLGPRPQVVELPDGDAQEMLAYEYGVRAWELRANARVLDDARVAELITQMMEGASGWKKGDRPNRIKVNVNRIYPEQMLTGTLAFHRRMGFNQEDNRHLMAMGCWTMLEVLAQPANCGRLEDEVKRALDEMRDLDAKAPFGWRCTHRTCRVRDACTRT
jgi:predicted acylesterase/phospholipase RssA